MTSPNARPKHVKAESRSRLIRLIEERSLLRDTDVMSMAHSLEIRVPLMDHKLVELMLALPGALKIAGKTPKNLLVDAMPSKPPDRTVYRKKMGFTLPFESWMRKQLKREVEQVLMSPTANLAGVICEKTVQQVWQDFLAGTVTWSRPWALYVLKKWADRNLSNS